jgi:Holliday junction resolvase RusA-like endonuclease
MNCETCGKKDAKEKKLGLFGSLWLCEKHSKELEEYLALSKEEKIKKILENLEKNKRTILTFKSFKEVMDLSSSGGWILNLPFHPISLHSEKELKKEFDKLIDEEIKRRNLNRNIEKYNGKEISLVVRFFITFKHNKDVDNMTKPLLDSIKNRMFGDDKLIVDCCIKKIFVKKEIAENIVIRIKSLD